MDHLLVFTRKITWKLYMAKFPRPRAKKMVKQSTQLKELKTETQQPQFKELEIKVERQISAIRVVRDVDIERLLMELRLVRSCFNEEQLRKPMLQRMGNSM
ncbi:uncharacterized protein LOC110269136 [Arachis ipaensis]|uniref:uncharacterized protein LOC110269136 n=1 Tax=Arachis ipaensis TaxID=130454 RepID=UPI000A2B8A95|nr:uncharacterized protein LOC110269136 [Arachis ipaensis]